MTRLLRQFDGGFIGKRARAYRSVLVGKKGVALCALVALATDTEYDFHMVHVFRFSAEEVSHGVDIDLGEEFRLYSWIGLLEFLNSLHEPGGEGFDNLFDTAGRACKHRPEFQPVR